MAIQRSVTEAALSFCPRKYVSLLLALLVLVVAYPFFMHSPLGLFLVDLLFVAVLLFEIYAVAEKKSSFHVALGLALAFMVGKWSSEVVESNPALFLIGESVGVLFFAFAGITLLSLVLRDEDMVTIDTIFGAVSVYFMIGLTWALLYCVVEGIRPESFFLHGEPFQTTQTPDRGFAFFVYYSFVTLTTMGYGDMIPVTGPARVLSFSEAIIGQIYLVVMIARFVGLHIAQSSNKNAQGASLARATGQADIGVSRVEAKGHEPVRA